MGIFNGRTFRGVIEFRGFSELLWDFCNDGIADSDGGGGGGGGSGCGRNDEQRKEKKR